jgi:uncharacterized protein YecE (DUF72 family)
MKKGSVYIGTSGWSYRHWKGTFYPAGLPAKEAFAFYAARFSTVEINNSFYRLLPAATFAQWQSASPKGFIFSVKAPRFITHMKKLKTDHTGLEEFFLNIQGLKRKAGPVLFQLPPKWKINLPRLQDFLSRLPTGHRYTFEFRDTTWYTDRTYRLLEKHNCAFCIYHLASHQSPVEVTADFVYIRLHGPGNKYQGSYTSAELKSWAARCRKWLRGGLDVYIYFDNDEAGYAAGNAKELQRLLM